MTTHTTATRIRHDSDATFREWIQEFETALTAIGLTQTADTGQINTSTATRPGTNASAGYQIWRFNDAMQATSPIYIRIEYRTGGGATIPMVFIAHGTGTNGAGTLTGTTSFATSSAFAGAVATADTLYNSYWCYVDGCLAWNWKQGAAGNDWTFILCRTTDNTGTADGDGSFWYTCSAGSLRTRWIRYVGTAALGTEANAPANAGPCHLPWNPAGTLVGTEPQVSTGWLPMPRFKPFVGAVGVLNAEFTTGNTFVHTAVGTTPRTYIAATNNAFMNHQGSEKAAFLWE